MTEQLPAWAKRALRDAIEGAIVAVGALNIAFPSTLDDAKASALILWTAVAGAFVAAARRAISERLAGGEG